MMILCAKIQIKLLRESALALLLPLLLLPFQLQADDSLKGDIKNGQSIAAEKCECRSQFVW